MFNKEWILLIVLSVLSVPSFGKPVIRSNLTIRSLHPMAVDRTHCTSCSGITRIYVNQDVWGNSSCRKDAADLLKEDSHLLSILLMGWASGKKLRIEVNDQVKPIDKVCKVTAIWVEEP